jgi:hypothetical protein
VSVESCASLPELTIGANLESGWLNARSCFLQTLGSAFCTGEALRHCCGCIVSDIWMPTSEGLPGEAQYCNSCNNPLDSKGRCSSFDSAMSGLSRLYLRLASSGTLPTTMLILSLHLGWLVWLSLFAVLESILHHNHRKTHFHRSPRLPTNRQTQFN